MNKGFLNLKAVINLFFLALNIKKYKNRVIAIVTKDKADMLILTKPKTFSKYLKRGVTKRIIETIKNNMLFKLLIV